MLVSSGCANMMLLEYYGGGKDTLRSMPSCCSGFSNKTPRTLPLILCNLSVCPSVLVLYSVWCMTTSCLNSRAFNPWESEGETEN